MAADAHASPRSAAEHDEAVRKTARFLARQAFAGTPVGQVLDGLLAQLDAAEDRAAARTDAAAPPCPVCPDCDGDGQSTGDEHECPVCDYAHAPTCPTCRGQGFVIAAECLIAIPTPEGTPKRVPCTSPNAERAPRPGDARIGQPSE